MDAHYSRFALNEFLEYISKLGKALVVESKPTILSYLKNIHIRFPECYQTPNEFFGFLVLYHAKNSIEEIIQMYWPLLVMYDDSFFEDYISYGRKGDLSEKFRIFLDSFKEMSNIKKDVFETSTCEFEVYDGNSKS